MKKKKGLSVALSLSLALSATGGQVFANDEVTIPDYENLQDVLKEGLSVKNFKNKQYSADDVVRMIVELNEKPLLDYAKDSHAKDVVSFLNSSKGKSEKRKIEKQQEKVRKDIEKTKQKIVVETKLDVVLNGFVVSAPYSEMERISSIPGVKRVVISEQNELVKPVDGYVSMANSSGLMMDSDRVNEEGYDGDGILVAVLDTGLDTDHEAFQKAPNEPKLSHEDVNKILEEGNLTILDDKMLSNWVYDEEKEEYVEIVKERFNEYDTYKNEKIPYAFDYSHLDTDTRGGDSHGTHVSGSVAANSSTLTGVAPDAQLMMMKVFNDKGTGAADDIILKALEDSIILGADVINMSLGTPGGHSSSASEVENDVFNRVMAAGINLMCSAGNDTSSSYLNQYGNDLALLENPDNSIVGEPSTFNAPLSVASVNETIIVLDYFKVGEEIVTYSDTSESEDQRFNKLDGTFEYVMIPNVGAPEDYKGLDVKGKIAVVQRGDISFIEKQNNARDAGAIAVVIYNNQAGTIYMEIDPNSIPAVSVTQEIGQMMALNNNKEMSVSPDYCDKFMSEDGGEISEFSSIGVTPDLKLKPEITAPGGNVYSTLPGSKYGNMSGTSMASPHMAGAAAVIRQYLNEQYPNLTLLEKELLANNMLMSTTQIIKDSKGTFVTPRSQGAGLANVYNAIHAQAYLTVKGNDRTKAELGYSEEGKYSFTFTIHNTSDVEHKYQIDTTALTSYVVEENGVQFISNDSREMKDNEMKISYSKNGAIKVKPHSQTTITVKMNLTKKGKDSLSVFPNGVFVDGFVQLKGIGLTTTDLNMPFLAFYGDWYQATVYDNTKYDDELAFQFESFMGAYYSDWFTGKEELYYLGVNAFTGKFDADKIAYYPDGSWTVVTSLTGLLRDTKTSSFQVLDSNGNEVWSDPGQLNNIKSFYYANGGFVNYMMDEWGWMPWDYDDDFNVVAVPEGDYTYKILSTIDGSDKVQELSYKVTIDGTKPELTNYEIVEENGSKSLIIDVKDNHHLMGIQLFASDGETELTDIIGIDSTEEVGETVSLKIDGIDKLLEYGIDKVHVQSVDYALNIGFSEAISLNIVE